MRNANQVVLCGVSMHASDTAQWRPVYTYFETLTAVMTLTHTRRHDTHRVTRRTCEYEYTAGHEMERQQTQRVCFYSNYMHLKQQDKITIHALTWAAV